MNHDFNVAAATLDRVAEELKANAEKQTSHVDANYVSLKVTAAFLRGLVKAKTILPAMATDDEIRHAGLQFAMQSMSMERHDRQRLASLQLRDLVEDSGKPMTATEALEHQTIKGIRQSLDSPRNKLERHHCASKDAILVNDQWYSLPQPWGSVWMDFDRACHLAGFTDERVHEQVAVRVFAHGASICTYVLRKGDPPVRIYGQTEIKVHWRVGKEPSMVSKDPITIVGQVTVTGDLPKK